MTAGWAQSTLSDVADVIGRGITPKYVPTGGTIVLNQKCIRDGRLSLEPARRHDSSIKVVKAEKFLRVGDVVVNSTGVGTLGRTAPVRSLDESMTVDSHVTIVRPHEDVDPGWLAYTLSINEPVIEAMAEGSTGQTELSRQRLSTLLIYVPSIYEQREISVTLEALDAKIDSNLRIRTLLRELGKTQFSRATRSYDKRAADLADLTLSIARGVAPTYADHDPAAPLVLNQKCVRDGWVSTEPARRMAAREVAAARKASSGDILVNSTGVGTLGRVGRWHNGDVFVDGHMSVVKPNPHVTGPTTLAYALFDREADIVELGTGSTGQTELSPYHLGSLSVEIPEPRLMAALESDLLAIERKVAQCATENVRLTALRNSLLPELLSGRILVTEGCKAVTETVL